MSQGAVVAESATRGDLWQSPLPTPAALSTPTAPPAHGQMGQLLPSGEPLAVAGTHHMDHHFGDLAFHRNPWPPGPHLWLRLPADMSAGSSPMGSLTEVEPAGVSLIALPSADRRSA